MSDEVTNETGADATDDPASSPMATQDVLDRIEPINIEEEMQRAYIDYSMSVIVGRALPDARDGLKPGNRRILFAMREGGYTHNRAYIKCARVVGDVIGKYHPHGDSAVYDTLVRMAQTFATRCLLIDGQGNFGSIDGDSAAAYRYTECRLKRAAEELLADIDKDTVEMQPNYDEKLQEPTVLPARLPNLLINGSTGIAVGMATNIPPHNTGEIIDGIVHLIDHPEATIADLMEFVKGPDFPTGGTLCGWAPIRSMYETGRGLLKLRGKAEVEEWKSDRERIIITEIPYALNKTSLIEKIAALVHEKRIEGISDLRDESDKDGIRMVVELKRGAIGQVVLNNLYKQTQLASTFGAILLAIDHGRPRVMNLKELMNCFIEHRFEVLTRRTQFELREAQARAHILEGLLIAQDHLDEVVRLIRASSNRDEARVQLIGRFGLSELQANAILDMRLYQLTGLERDKLEGEYTALKERIAYLQELLADDAKLYGVMKADLIEMRGSYADARRTEIVADAGDINMEDLVPDEDSVITLSHGGYIKRTPTHVYREQKRGGKGIAGMNTKDDDYVEHVFNCTAHDWMLFFTEQGRMYFKKAYEIPEGSRTSKGKALVNLLNVNGGEKIASIIPVRGFDTDQNLFFATERGRVKKTALRAYQNVRAAGIIAIRIDEGDRLIDVELTNGENEILMVTRRGKGIRFQETDVRPMGRATGGVRGITLGEDDVVEGVEVIHADAMLLTVTVNGFGKRTPFSDYRVQRRGGRGLIANVLTEKTGNLVTAFGVQENDAMMMVTRNGTMIRVPVDGVRITGRSAQGVKLINLAEDDEVMSATPVEPLNDEDDLTEGEEAGAESSEETPTPPAESDAPTAAPPPAESSAPEEGTDS
ncbi:MAG: DNA gyrase subunit A [Kiritimatiellae bacterium]|nr:DNA gyrase subunit A [Kiritimatiellia bacterium]MDD4341701.1 DNA gyrase subunit A [Kiritimatiellia bacterium]